MVMYDKVYMKIVTIMLFLRNIIDNSKCGSYHLSILDLFSNIGLFKHVYLSFYPSDISYIKCRF